ncbi:MAG: hypothetical protein JXO22_17155, partial [Phycisphaerae bacterium]|nr:hypothetical protein [Phycisphaerae bacterium]
VPSRLTIPLDPPQPVELRSRLIWVGDAPGKITDVTITDPKLTARAETINGNDYLIVDLPAGYKIPANQRSLGVMVRTDDPQAPLLRLQAEPARTPVRRTIGPGSGAAPGSTSPQSTDTAANQKQPTAPAGEPRVPAGSAVQPTPSTGTESTPQPPAPAEGKPGSGCAGSDTPPIAQAAPGGPQPHMVLDQTTVTNAEPIWRGKPAVFAFNVKNDGEGPLSIKAAG